jgi:phosphatidylglycerophosphate synthase
MEESYNSKGGEKMRSFKILVPNSITFLRLVSVGIGCWLVAHGSYQLAFIVILVGALTDLFDGLAARLLKAVTKFGHFFDHIVDIVFLLFIFYITFKHLFIPLVVVFALLETVVICISIKEVCSPSGKEWPNNWGKWAYGFFIGAGCTTLFMAKTNLWSSFYWIANIVLVVSIYLRIRCLVVYKKEAEALPIQERGD